MFDLEHKRRRFETIAAAMQAARDEIVQRQIVLLGRYYPEKNAGAPKGMKCDYVVRATAGRTP
jgi:hypothetical protein